MIRWLGGGEERYGNDWSARRHDLWLSLWMHMLRPLCLETGFIEFTLHEEQEANSQTLNANFDRTTEKCLCTIATSSRTPNSTRPRC